VGETYSDPFHTGGWTGKSPYFFDFWYCRTNSVRSKSKVGRFSGENPYSNSGHLASTGFAACQMSGFYPRIVASREVQLGSLAAIGFLLQIRDLLGDIDRFESSVRFKFSRSVRFKFFLEPFRFDSNFSWNPKVVKKSQTLFDSRPL
jgi:hypothetical protein